VSVFGIRASGFEFRVSGFGFRVSGFGFRVSGFGFRVSGFGVSPFWSRPRSPKASQRTREMAAVLPPPEVDQIVNLAFRFSNGRLSHCVRTRSAAGKKVQVTSSVWFTSGLAGTQGSGFRAQGLDIMVYASRVNGNR